jgi:hypothetical protein
MKGRLLQIKFNGEQFAEAMKTKASRIADVIASSLNAQMYLLSGYIVEKHLSGPRPSILGRVTGKLAASIRVNEATLDGNKITASVDGAGGPAWYGRIHEYGGSYFVAMRAISAKTIALRSLAKMNFATRSYSMTFPERSFMRSSLAENADKITGAVKDAINGEINKP